jgi:hypothetical protein
MNHEPDSSGTAFDCPVCGNMRGFLNLVKVHVGICDDCKVLWSVGYNLSSSWRHETESDWERNQERLNAYLEQGYRNLDEERLK